MSVDPSQLGGAPPAAGGLPPGDPTQAPMAPSAPPPPAAPLPTTNPEAMMAVLQALQQNDLQQFQGMQSAALGTAVTELLKQTPNPAGEAASTLPGGPTPPPMPGEDPNAAPVDPTMAGGSGY